MTIRRCTAVTALSAALLLSGLTACSGDGDTGDTGDAAPATTTAAPTTAAPTTAAPTTAAPTTATTTPPTPSPSAAPLSRFENDAGVKAAIRAYFLANAQAINASNGKLPALLAVTTAYRQSQFASTDAFNKGGYVPGPDPATPLAVRNAATTTKVVTTCALFEGWTLTRKGAHRSDPAGCLRSTSPSSGRAGSGKVDEIESTTTSCKGVKVVEQTFEDLAGV